MTNKPESYHILSKIFHWGMALIILGLVPVGLYMTAMEYSPEKLKIYALHKSFGFLVLWLVGLRIIWKHIATRPLPNPDHQLLSLIHI